MENGHLANIIFFLNESYIRVSEYTFFYNSIKLIFVAAMHHFLLLYILTGSSLVLTLLLAARALVLGRDVNDAVGIDVKGDLDLGDSARGRGDSHQGELTQHLVVCSHLSLTLTHLDLHLCLAVGCRGEDLQRTERDAALGSVGSSAPAFRPELLL